MKDGTEKLVYRLDIELDFRTVITDSLDNLIDKIKAMETDGWKPSAIGAVVGLAKAHPHNTSNTPAPHPISEDTAWKMHHALWSHGDVEAGK